MNMQMKEDTYSLLCLGQLYLRAYLEKLIPAKSDIGVNNLLFICFYIAILLL